MGRVLVTEKLAQTGLDLMAEAGYDVDVQLGLSPDELLGAIVGAQALVIRSATPVAAEVLAAGTDLVVVGRAGIGLDNVDVPAATERGVMVVNAPQSNILSAAAQAMALLLAQARNIPQAHDALVAGKYSMLFKGDLCRHLSLRSSSRPVHVTSHPARGLTAHSNNSAGVR